MLDESGWAMDRKYLSGILSGLNESWLTLAVTSEQVTLPTRKYALH
jgi:hypothetical protein